MSRQPEGHSVVSLYLAEIGKRSVLTREQEGEIARSAERSGNKAELNMLVESNLSFVVKIANEHRNMGLSFEDLLNEGNIGLIEAAHRYDPSKGTKFITYAVWWIRKNMMDAIYNQTGVIRVPKYRKKKAIRIRETEDRLSHELGRQPCREEISSDLACTVSDVDTTLMLKPSVTSLDDDLGDEGATISQIVADGEAPDPETELLRNESRDLVRWALQWLNERERTIITQRVGMHGGRCFTLKEIGERMGLSRERIRQIETEAKGKLRRILEYLTSPPPRSGAGEARIPPRFARSPVWRERQKSGWKARTPHPAQL